MDTVASRIMDSKPGIMPLPDRRWLTDRRQRLPEVRASGHPGRTATYPRRGGRPQAMRQNRLKVTSLTQAMCGRAALVRCARNRGRPLLGQALGRRP